MTEIAGVHLRKFKILVEGMEETMITAVWINAGVDHCHVSFLLCHMVKHATWYDCVVVQVNQSHQMTMVGIEDDNEDMVLCLSTHATITASSIQAFVWQH
jgi:hypothetical protein